VVDDPFRSVVTAQAPKLTPCSGRSGGELPHGGEEVLFKVLAFIPRESGSASGDDPGDDALGVFDVMKP
jgi:hypothetical protein